ncbi:MAG: hypothetical protein QXO03_04220, partial [Thermoplasmatales archaeon]
MRKKKILLRDFVKVRRISSINELNPFLISWLKSGKKIEYVIIKKKDVKPTVYPAKESETLMKNVGWYLGESTHFSEHGKRLFIKGDPRHLEFSDINHADKIIELLEEEEEGYVKVCIRHHYFPSRNNNRDIRARKWKERTGWKLNIEFEGDSIGAYIKHVFSAPGVSSFSGGMGIWEPVIALWEVPNFIPSYAPPERNTGVAIGRIMESGKVYVDFERDPHAMIAGSSGSGKSTMIVGMMNYILENKLGNVT